MRRIKVQYDFGQDEGEGDVIESDWLHSITDFSGPTKTDRGRVFGWDKPVPEVGAEVAVLLKHGDPADAYWFGQPNYGEGDTSAPGQFKGAFKDVDWAWRWADPSGYEEGCDVEGNHYQFIPGNDHIKVGCNRTVEVRGVYNICALYLGLIVLTVLRQIAAKFDISRYPRPEEAETLRKLLKETMRPGGPVREDPGIGKIEPFEE